LVIRLCLVYNCPQVVTIAMVGKYTELSDAYLSITKALQHACMAANRKLKLEWVEASNLEPVEAGKDGKEGDSKAHDGAACGMCSGGGCSGWDGAG
jgi:CTP synthase